MFNGPGATYAGRIHSNGNMCIGSGDPSYFEKLTSAGRIYKLRGSGCRTENSGGIGARSVFVSRAPLANGAATYATPGFESGFSLLFDKDADSSDWLTAAALWNGQIADATHGVPILRAPIRGTPLVQQGRNAVHALTSNTRNSRFLIDPLIPGEPDDVRQQKVAFKADLRILDGVWYLRDPARPAELGTPIWSDHPGQARTTTDTERWANPTQDVGQGDLFGTGARPTRYSHYRTIPGSISLDTVVGGSAVISYGVVHRAGGLTVPGHQRTTPIAVCSENAPCFPTHASSTPAQFLQGTRGGFRSAWDESGATDGAADCGADREASLGLGDIDARQSPLFNMLPINFDVAAFQQALQDTDTNELGGRLVARGEPFNGAVWIGSTWPGFRVGFGNDAASGPARFWPFQGQQDDDRSGAGGTVADSTNQPFDGLETAVRTRAAVYQGPTDFAVSSPTTKENRPYQRALPQPLCTDSGPAVDLVLASYDAPSTFDGAGSTRQFFAPSCSASADGHLNSRPNAVRLINAAVLDRSILPKGLSVVTNLPMFLLGDVNTSSVPADRPGERHAGWTPLMVGGDTIGLLSNAWSDAQAPWNVPVRMYWPTRDAASTQYHGAFLYGWAEAALGPSGGCREELSYSAFPAPT